MKLFELLARLPRNMFSLICTDDNEAEIRGIRLISKSQKEFKEDVLYFGDFSMLPENRDELKLFNFMGYGNSPAVNKCLYSNIVSLFPETDHFHAYNTLQGVFVEEQDLTDKVRRLLAALVSNNGLQHLVDEGASVLGNPVFVVDSSYHYIAMQTGELSSDGSVFEQIISKELEYDSILEGGIEYIRKNKLDETLWELERPLCHYHEHFETTVMISPVRVDGIEVAHVMMVEHHKLFSGHDEECFMRLVSFVGQEMQKSSLYKKNKGQMNSYFLINLLNDSQPRKSVIERRLKILDYKQKGKFYLTVLQPESGSLDNRSFDIITSQLHGVLTGNIYAMFENRLIILFNREKDGTLGEYTIDVLRRYASANKLSAGVSNEFTELTEVRRFYEQAKSAAHFGKRVDSEGGEKSVFFYMDVCYYEMFDICSQQTHLMNYCHPGIEKLMEYDRANNANLVGTLYVYLINFGNTQKSAKTLCMHKNTMLYRLDRIKTITGSELVSGEEFFLYSLSYRVLISLGLFSPDKQDFTAG